MTIAPRVWNKAVNTADAPAMPDIPRDGTNDFPEPFKNYPAGEFTAVILSALERHRDKTISSLSGIGAHDQIFLFQTFMSDVLEVIRSL